MTLVFSYEDGSLDGRSDVLAVDGVFGIGPNLSHWPGNRTPTRYRHDLSTGMALRLAACADRASFLRGITTVSNNHYDTDGVLSVFACLNPDQALEISEALLDAAAAGDFLEIRSEAALRFDRIVAELTHHRDSPIYREAEGLGSTDRHKLAYAWLLPRVPELIRTQGSLEPLWIESVLAHDRSLREFASGRAVIRKTPTGIALVNCDVDLALTAVISLARPSARILIAQSTEGGTKYRFLQTTRSWFDQVSLAPPRFDLLPTANELQQMEPLSEGKWYADGIAAPLAELAFGVERKRGDPTQSRVNQVPSALSLEVVLTKIEAAAACATAAPSRF